MPIAKVRLADGRIAKFEVPEGTTPEQVEEFARQMPAQQKAEPQAKETVLQNIGRNVSGAVAGLGEAAMNAPKSTVDLLNNIGKAVLHPLDTAQAVGEVVTGGAQKLIPGQQENEGKFDSVVDFFKGRYGSNEGLKKAISEDPAGVMADLSTLLMGGGAIANAGKLGKVGEVLNTAGKAVDPLNAAASVAKPVVNAGGRAVREVVGTATGAGPEAVNQALKGKGLTADSSDFVKGLRGGTTGEDILADAQGALGKVKEQRSATYRQRLGEIAKDNRLIDLRPIKQKTADLMRQYNIRVVNGELDFSRSALDRNARGEVAEIINTVSGWGKEAGDNTAIGLDTLKRQLDDFYTDSKNSKALVTALRNEVKGQIVKNVPEYATMTKDYETITRLTGEMEKALSLSNKAMMDTALKKLSSTMRENFGFRRDLLNQLEELSGRDLSAVIAGNDMNQVLPRGLVGKLAGGGVVGAGAATGQLANPYFLSMAAVSSPRVMGEFLNALGYSRNQAAKIVDMARRSNAATTGKRNAAFQAGRANEEEQ